MKLINNIAYTVESVLKGHPDKICDQISDAILDFYLLHDENSHTAIECLGTGNQLIVAGEINSSVKLPIEQFCIDEYAKITGYYNINIVNLLSQQSDQLISATLKGRAGDQGIMYGYACKNEYNYLPYGHWLVNNIARRLDDYRETSQSFLPDGKVQVRIDNGYHINKLTINVQHSCDTDVDALRSILLENVLYDVIADSVEINPVGLFINGGFLNDTGLTGRKIIIDTYGGMVPHGGGAFSGKDPSKVDRSAAYMCRFVAKNIVANGIAQECIVSVAYEFGRDYPAMINIVTDGKIKKSTQELVKKYFDFRPEAIIERLNLRKVRFLPTATYGHFTDPSYEWEQIIDI